MNDLHIRDAIGNAVWNAIDDDAISNTVRGVEWAIVAAVGAAVDVVGVVVYNDVDAAIGSAVLFESFIRK